MDMKKIRGMRWVLSLGVLGGSLVLVTIKTSDTVQSVPVVREEREDNVIRGKQVNVPKGEQASSSKVSGEKPYTAVFQDVHAPCSKQVPPTFGKSHFIVGMSAEETARHCATVPLAKKGEDHVNAYDMVCLGVFPQVLFSPHDEVRKALVYLIDHEKKSVRMAAYTVTEPKVAQALCAAKKRGVAISLVVDRSCLDMTSNKIKILRKTGVDVAIFDGKTHEDGALMHNKFFLFEENIKNKKLVWTGSTNTTKSGYERNHENAMIVEEAVIFARYEKEFELLISLSERLKS